MLGLLSGSSPLIPDGVVGPEYKSNSGILQPQPTNSETQYPEILTSETLHPEAPKLEILKPHAYTSIRSPLEHRMSTQPRFDLSNHTGTEIMVS